MPVHIQYDGQTRAALRGALLDAFPSPFDMAALLADRLNRPFFALVPPFVNYDIQLFELLTSANAQAWIADLVVAALEAAPRNPKLREFATEHNLASATKMEIGDAHQRMVDAGVLAFDVAVWRSRLGELEAQTCRVEVQLDQGGTACGTGFLLGPSILITNYHVLEPAYLGLEGKTTAKGYSARPSKVTFRFDYKRLPEGILNAGVTYTMAEDWDLDRSETCGDVEADAPPDRLDYALVRLAEPAGGHKLGKKVATTGNERGWMSPLAVNALPAGTPLFVLQHPKGDPLKLGMSTDGVISVTGGGTRLRHRVNTEAGSSGSPCFNQRLELVALHHAGDPDFERPATWNQAIPFSAILALLEQRGKRALLGT